MLSHDKKRCRHLGSCCRVETPATINKSLPTLKRSVVVHNPTSYSRSKALGDQLDIVLSVERQQTQTYSSKSVPRSQLNETLRPNPSTLKAIDTICKATAQPTQCKFCRSKQHTSSIETKEWHLQTQENGLRTQRYWL